MMRPRSGSRIGGDEGMGHANAPTTVRNVAQLEARVQALEAAMGQESGGR